jgi:ketosteroid isomerase-like protein
MKIVTILLALVIGSMTIAQQDMEKQKDALKQADLDFSNLSKEKGMRESFLAYIAETGVLLRPNMMPVEGLDAVKKLLEEGNTDFVLTWAPLFADISNSGELGYTYGTFDLSFKDDQGASVTRKGSYVTIWKKDSKGNWKFVLDTGNPGLEPPVK